MIFSKNMKKNQIVNYLALENVMEKIVIKDKEKRNAARTHTAEHER